MLWRLQYSFQEADCLVLLETVVLFDLLVASHDLRDKLSVLTESLAVRQENERAVPSDHFAAHDKDRSVRVDGASLVEKSHGVLRGVKDDHWLAEEVQINNVA